MIRQDADFPVQIQPIPYKQCLSKIVSKLFSAYIGRKLAAQGLYLADWLLFVPFQEGYGITSISSPDPLLQGVGRRSVGVCVVGLGYVGLPTLGVIGSSGFSVIGVDINPEIVEKLARGEDSTGEPGLRSLLSKLVKSGKVSATGDVGTAMKESEIVFICVQTPVTKARTPDLSFLERAAEGVGRNLRRGMLVILGSTVPPGTTRRVVVPILERLSGLRAGVDFWLAHSPERISPGAAIRTFKERKRLVGGVNEESGRVAAEFLRAIGVKRVVEGECGAVEVAKTAENTFRDVNIALANELALLCEEVGVDVYEAIRLANTHERVNIHRPGAGVGGPCLTKDPYLLINPRVHSRVDAKLIRNARELNDAMPEHVVDLVLKNMEELGLEPRSMTVGVLGVTFRGGTDDVRNSPAEEIIRSLIAAKSRVISYDPMSEETFGSERVKDAHSVLARAVCVVIASDHSEFKRLPIPARSSLRLIVDGRRVLDPRRIPPNINYVAVGDVTHAREKPHAAEDPLSVPIRHKQSKRRDTTGKNDEPDEQR